jgi:adenine phosphoribosyltransferase
MAAAVKLVRQTGAHVIGVAFVIELSELKGRDKLTDVQLFTLLKY